MGSATAADLRPHSTECPRCGYDLSGAVAAWPAGQCPIGGVCSECGLQFPWRRLFDDPGARVPWLPEARSRVRHKFVRTALRTLHPGAFWRQVPLELPIRYAILTAFAIGPLILLYGVFSGAAVWSEYAYWAAVPPAFKPIPNGSIEMAAFTGVWPFRHMVMVGSRVVDLWAPGLVALFVILSHAAMGIVYVVLVVTFKRMRIRRRHIVRAIAYGTPLTALASLLLIGTLLAADVSRLGRWIVLPFIGVEGLLTWYWWAFARCYLRLPHAGVVAIAGTVLSVLTTLIVMYAIPTLAG